MEGVDEEYLRSQVEELSLVSFSLPDAGVNLHVTRNESQEPLPTDQEGIIVPLTGIPSTEPKKADGEKEAKTTEGQPKKQKITKKDDGILKNPSRKPGNVEDDFDENLMTQLKTSGLPLLNIVEPDIGQAYNTCAIFGSGDLSKFNMEDYSKRFGDLTGDFGHCELSSQLDFYSTKPFGKETPMEKVILCEE